MSGRDVWFVVRGVLALTLVGYCGWVDGWLYAFLLLIAGFLIGWSVGGRRLSSLVDKDDKEPGD